MPQWPRAASANAAAERPRGRYWAAVLTVQVAISLILGPHAARLGLIVCASSQKSALACSMSHKHLADLELR
jgi:hypothetical protein